MASEETALWASPGPCSLEGNRWSRSTTCFPTRKIEGHRTPKSSQIIPNRIPFESWCFLVISNNPCRTGLCGLGFKVLAATAAAPWCKWCCAQDWFLHHELTSQLNSNMITWCKGNRVFHLKDKTVDERCQLPDEGLLVPACMCGHGSRFAATASRQCVNMCEPFFHHMMERDVKLWEPIAHFPFGLVPQKGPQVPKSFIK